MQHYGEPDPINPGSVGGVDIAAAEAAPAAEPEGPIQPPGRSGLTWEAAINGLRDVLADQTERAVQSPWQRSRILTAMDLMVANSATPPAPEQGQGRWTEGVCGDGAAILFDGAMVPIKEVVRALNGRPATLPAPELLEANFRAWHKEARGSLYYGAMPLCDAIEWAQHLLQQVTLQALVPPAVPAPPITEPSALPELVRYGFIGCGPNRPLLIRLVDGYWTPWHIAATLLQRQQAELASLRVAPVVVSERPWEREGWCDAEGRCWFCNAYSMGRWSYDTPPDPEQDWGRLGALTHSLPHWAIQRPRAIPQPAPQAGAVQP